MNAPGGARTSIDERRRLVAQSLQVGNPADHAGALAPPVLQERHVELDVQEIRPYEHNPRRAGNDRFDDIKESIRTGGLRVPLTVTRRPSETHYVVEAGGNTRLQALQQLWTETGDPRYRRLTVLFRPWRSESHVLTAHLIENEQRGEMSFWDRACGIAALKGRLEAERGRTLSLRPLEDALHGLGLAVNTATLALYLFATERLRTLGDAVPGLTGLDVKTLQPRLNALRRYAEQRHGLEEDALYAEVFEPAFRRIAEQAGRGAKFSVELTVQACELALAARFGEPVQALGALAGSSGRRSSAPVPGPSATQGLPSPTSLPECVRAFAERAGLGAALQRCATSPLGYRLAAPPESALSPLSVDVPAGRSPAWSALALLQDQDGQEFVAQATSAREFVRWLTDPDDAAAEAFWDVLQALRGTRPSAGPGSRGTP